MRLARAIRKLKAHKLPIPEKQGGKAPRYISQASAVGDLYA